MACNIDIREIRVPEDALDIESFLDDSDRSRLKYLPLIICSGDGFAYVAESNQGVVGWMLVHTNFRKDIGWKPCTEEGNFHKGENAYLENIAVTAECRNNKVGGKLLRMAETHSFQIGKRKMWLHVSERNVRAIRFYEREGWEFQRTVYPGWYENKPMKIYCKDLGIPD